MTVQISVAMATYNGEKYIKQQLDSLARQTVHPKELVVCDDCSTDSTVLIVESFASSAPFPVCIIINEKNLGYTDNFLKCAALCKGDWIAFCDQDDYWMPNKIQRVVQKICNYEDNDLLLIGHTSIVGDNNLKISRQCVPYFKKDIYLKRCNRYAFNGITGFSAVAKSNLIRDFNHTLRPRFSDSGDILGHDQWIDMLANAVGTTGYISEPLAIWRRHNLSTTGTPADENLLLKAKMASRALDPDVYFLKGRMTENASKSLEDIASEVVGGIYKERLLDASKSFYKLARNLKLRGQLYSTGGGINALRGLLLLLLNNAYFDKPINSLGLRSFLKDCSHVFGILNIIKFIRKKNSNQFK